MRVYAGVMIRNETGAQGDLVPGYKLNTGLEGDSRATVLPNYREHRAHCSGAVHNLCCYMEQLGRVVTRGVLGPISCTVVRPALLPQGQRVTAGLWAPTLKNRRSAKLRSQ